MTQTTSCTIKLFNKSYEIKCPEHEKDNLMHAAEKLNRQMLINKKKSKHLDNFHLLLLSALDISHQLVVSKSQQAQHNQQVSQFINSLENKISQMVHQGVEDDSESE